MTASARSRWPTTSRALRSSLPKDRSRPGPRCGRRARASAPAGRGGWRRAGRTYRARPAARSPSPRARRAAAGSCPRSPPARRPAARPRPRRWRPRCPSGMPGPTTTPGSPARSRASRATFPARRRCGGSLATHRALAGQHRVGEWKPSMPTSRCRPPRRRGARPGGLDGPGRPGQPQQAPSGAVARALARSTASSIPSVITAPTLRRGRGRPVRCLPEQAGPVAGPDRTAGRRCATAAARIQSHRARRGPALDLVQVAGAGMSGESVPRTTRSCRAAAVGRATAPRSSAPHGRRRSPRTPSVCQGARHVALRRSRNSACSSMPIGAMTAVRSGWRASASPNEPGR